MELRAYIQLGTTGRSVFDIKEEIEQNILRTTITLKTSDSPNHSMTELSWIVKTPQQARVEIDRVFKYLQKQPWYFSEALSFTTSGLIQKDDNESEWYCDDCGEDITACQCK